MFASHAGALFADGKAPCFMPRLQLRTKRAALTIRCRAAIPPFPDQPVLQLPWVRTGFSCLAVMLGKAAVSAVSGSVTHATRLNAGPPSASRAQRAM